MPERDGYIAGVPCWVDTTQPDPEAAVEFYSGLFGWELEDVMPPGSPMKYFSACIRGGRVAAVGGQPAGAPPEATWNTYIWVDSADETAAKVIDAGGQVLTEPFDVMDAGRMAIFADPEGAAFCAWQANEHKGAQVINEHGALVFNVLDTADLDAAKSFYGAVFGWETLGGGDQVWALPGYGDHLELSNPGLRKQSEASGAPPGFEDAVALISPVRGGEPHWSVTFMVDDVDAIAARATELGGSVVVPPFDAPWVRNAVLADPQGATFIASKVVPENKDVQAQVGSPATAA